MDVVISDLEEVITNVGSLLKMYRRRSKRPSHTSVRIQSVWVLCAYGIITSCERSADRRTDYFHPYLGRPESNVSGVLSQVWARRCVATGRRLGEGSTFALTRWDRSKPAKVDNLILLAGSDIADQFDQQVGLETRIAVI